jgi:hypothetical protein
VRAGEHVPSRKIATGKVATGGIAPGKFEGTGRGKRRDGHSLTIANVCSIHKVSHGCPALGKESVKEPREHAENLRMSTHAPNPQPELGHDEHLSTATEELDPWSTGYILFSLGPDFDEAVFDAS